MNSPDILEEDIDRILNNRPLFEEMKGSSILITGVTGLIGSMLVRVFAAENDKNASGIHIIGQVRTESKAKEILGNLIERSDVQLICSSNFDLDVGCDYIIHTACPTTSKFFVNYPVETIDISLKSTRKMLALAMQNKIKGMVYLSSMEEYGEPYIKNQYVTEKDCGFIDHLNVRSCYPESKRMCECYCASYAAEYGVHVKIARLAQTFGAGAQATDNRAFMQFAKCVVDHKDIILHTEGKSTSNFCYLSDSIEGILTILLKGKSGEAFNICNDKETKTVLEVAEMVAEKIGEGKIKVVFDVPESANHYGYAPDVTMRLCADKLRAIGWTPKIGMEEAYRRLVTYLKKS